MTTGSECIWVIALTYRGFEQWLLDHDIPKGSGLARYVGRASDLEGLRNVRLVFAENWTDRSDWREIWNAAERAGRRPR